MTETEILRILFPPEGAIPLARIDSIPQIRKHIAAILSLAGGRPVWSAGDSRAITQRIVHLHNQGVGGAAMAPEFALSANACQKRYTKFVKDQERHPIYTAGPSPGYEAVEVKTSSNHSPADPTQTGYSINPDLDSSGDFSAARIPTVEGGKQKTDPPKIETASLQEAEPEQIETHAELEQKTEEPPTIRKSRTVETPTTLDPETLAEIDRLLGEGVSVLEISSELEKHGKLVPWTKIRARAAYLARMKKAGGGADHFAESDKKVASTEPKCTASTEEEPRDRPEPVSISRKELDLMMWDLWRAEKTPDEISDILYSKGLYYSPDTVRRRLIQQGATL